MKSRILKALAIAGVAAFGFATPAAAVTISFEIAGNELRVVAGDLGTDIIAAWDVDINFDPSLTVDPAVGSVFTNNSLGVTGLDTFFESDTSTPGLVDAFELSLLSDSDLDDLQNSPTLTLLTIRFVQDISNQQFSFTWDDFNDVKCANNRVCFPPVQLPEPGTLGLLALGILGAAVARRRRAARRSVAAF